MSRYVLLQVNMGQPADRTADGPVARKMRPLLPG